MLKANPPSTLLSTVSTRPKLTAKLDKVIPDSKPIKEFRNPVNSISLGNGGKIKPEIRKAFADTAIRKNLQVLHPDGWHQPFNRFIRRDMTAVSPLWAKAPEIDQRGNGHIIGAPRLFMQFHGRCQHLMQMRVHAHGTCFPGGIESGKL